WFAGRTWTWDYPAQRLLWRADSDVPNVAAEHRVKLGFKSEKDGSRSYNFPRVPVKIDGEMLDLLFDTGAGTQLTDAAWKAISDGRGAKRAASFITQSKFDAWHKKHPDWKMIDKAEERTDAAILEAPRIEVAGYEVGPVWFTARADKNFHEFMSQWM